MHGNKIRYNTFRFKLVNLFFIIFLFNRLEIIWPNNIIGVWIIINFRPTLVSFTIKQVSIYVKIKKYIVLNDISTVSFFFLSTKDKLSSIINIDITRYKLIPVFANLIPVDINWVMPSI